MIQFSEAMNKTPLIIDNGSGYIKAGSAGDERPKLIMPNYVGRFKYKIVLPTKINNSQVLIGNNITDELRGISKISYPMEHGIIKKFDEMDMVWKKVYNELNLSQKDQPVFITEPPLTPYKQKFEIARHFFENYQVPYYFSGQSGILTVMSTGKFTGLVLDSGDGVTHCVPVFEGCSLNHACSRIDLAGRDVTEYLQQLLRRQEINFTTSADFDTVKRIKEKRLVINLSAQPDEDQIAGQRNYKDPYFLPDGTEINLSHEKFRAPEILFNPEKIGLECMSLPELLISSINKSDMDLRKTLCNEILLAGGTTLIQGFPERILYEMRSKITADVHIKLQAPKERNLSVWIGASVFAGLSSFKSLWISKQEYEDHGDRILLKRSF